jgi:hypothetical protein
LYLHAANYFYRPDLTKNVKLSAPKDLPTDKHIVVNRDLNRRIHAGNNEAQKTESVRPVSVALSENISDAGISQLGDVTPSVEQSNAPKARKNGLRSPKAALLDPALNGIVFNERTSKDTRR